MAAPKPAWETWAGILQAHVLSHKALFTEPADSVVSVLIKGKWKRFRSYSQCPRCRYLVNELVEAAKALRSARSPPSPPPT